MTHCSKPIIFGAGGLGHQRSVNINHGANIQGFCFPPHLVIASYQQTMKFAFVSLIFSVWKIEWKESHYYPERQPLPIRIDAFGYLSYSYRSKKRVTAPKKVVFGVFCAKNWTHPNNFTLFKSETKAIFRCALCVEQKDEKGHSPLEASSFDWER